jgi:potassium efflux system protein
MFPLLVAPLVLGGLAAAGYYFSALQLTQCALATIWVTLALCVVNSFLVRSSHSAFRLIHNRRQMQRAQTVTRTDTNDSSVQEQEHEREDADIANMSQQMGRLLKLATIAAGIGLAWMIWDQVLPATAALNRVELWHYTAEVPQPSAADATRTELVKEARSITLGHALMMMMIALVTIAVSRNLPGLLEVVLLNRLPLDRGGKYAISIVCRYFVVIVGMLLAFRAIGITWHSVQWLAAAVTVGLGFGLQEIFANFVSGLIILLERPVRLGDLVTVNNTTGVVTRIQLRATTITDADRKEMVVPNKRFITDEVVNWSLTDPTIRVVVNIGVAHGADIQLVQRTLIQVARRHPLVLKEPAPSAVFRRFAENSLDFELRVFVPSFENSTEVLHQLNTAIDIAFRQAQIELASPKNDWHLRSVDGATLAAFTRGSVPHAPPGGSPAATDTKAA